MSVRIMSTIWDVPFPNSTQMLIALKLADHANDAGGDVWPGKASLAERTRCSVSTIKNILRQFREAGILIVVREGGKGGPTDTTEYRFNVGLLKALADGEVTMQGDSTNLVLACANPVEATGSEFDPLHFDRVSPLPVPGQPTTRYPVSPLTPNHQEPSRTITRAGARENFSNLDLRNAAARPVFHIGPSDIQWSAWMEHLKRLHRDDLVEAARDAGTLKATSRWPTGDDIPTVPGSKNREAAQVAKRMIGEGGR